MMFVKIANATGYNFESSFKLMAIKIDKISDVSNMIRRDISKQLTVIVIFVVLIDGASVQP